MREITGGEGVPVVFDGVGKATWDASLGQRGAARADRQLRQRRRRGRRRQSGVLARHGSLFVTRPTLFDYDATPEERQAAPTGCSRCWRSGAIRPEIGQTFALEDAAEAHRALEAGDDAGQHVLLP